MPGLFYDFELAICHCPGQTFAKRFRLEHIIVAPDNECGGLQSLDGIHPRRKIIRPQPACQDRKSVVKGKRESVRVALGARRTLRNTKVYIFQAITRIVKELLLKYTS